MGSKIKSFVTTVIGAVILLGFIIGAFLGTVLGSAAALALSLLWSVLPYVLDFAARVFFAHLTFDLLHHVAPQVPQIGYLTAMMLVAAAWAGRIAFGKPIKAGK